MKLVTYANRSVLMGATAADALMAYAAALASTGKWDSVSLASIGDDGLQGTVTMLLGAGAPLMTESVRSDLPSPDNEDATVDIVAKARRLTHPDHALPEDPQTVLTSDADTWH